MFVVSQKSERSQAVATAVEHYVRVLAVLTAAEHFISGTNRYRASAAATAFEHQCRAQRSSNHLRALRHHFLELAFFLQSLLIFQSKLQNEF